MTRSLSSYRNIFPFGKPLLLVAYSYAWHDSFIYDRHDLGSYVRHALLICVTWWIPHHHGAQHFLLSKPPFLAADSYAWHDAFICEGHDAFICVTWLIHIWQIWRIHMCDMTHSYVWHDSFIYDRYDSFTCVTWRIHMYDMTHSYMCDMTHSHVWHDACICVTWLILMCDMTYSYV